MIEILDSLPHLDDLDENEWRDICRKAKPEYSDSEFTQSWQEFLYYCYRKSLH